MSKKSRPVPKIILDPAFPAPAGAEDYFQYRNTSIVLRDAQVQEENDLEESYSDEIDPIDAVEEEGLVAPSYFNVISQEMRRAADGTTVVDLTIEIEDVPGANNYEIRSTP